LTAGGGFCIILIDKKWPEGLFLNINLNNMNKLTSYIQESVAEMKKVTWPTKKETYNYTLLVIGVSLGVAIFLGILDYIFNFGFKFIIYR